jgi:hypothetical protein
MVCPRSSTNTPGEGCVVATGRSVRVTLTGSLLVATSRPAGAATTRAGDHREASNPGVSQPGLSSLAS